MGEFKHSVKSSYDSMRRKMGLKGDFSRAHREKVARRKRLSPLGTDAIEDIEDQVGVPILDAKTRKRRRAFDRVADSILGSSRNDNLGG